MELSVFPFHQMVSFHSFLLLQSSLRFLSVLFSLVNYLFFFFFGVLLLTLAFRGIFGECWRIHLSLGLAQKHLGGKGQSEFNFL